MARSLLTASTFAGLALLLSRLSGLIREQVLGARLGLTAQADAAIFMLTLPDILVGLLLSGGFSAALVPALSRVDANARVVLMRRVLLWTGLAALILATVFFAATPIVLEFLAPSLDPTPLRGFRLGFAISLLAVPVAGMIGVASAYLASVRRYSIPALSVLVFNGLLIAYFVFALDVDSVHFAVFGAVVLVACLLRLLFQLSQMPEALRFGLAPQRFLAGFGVQFIQGVTAYSLIVAVPIIFRSLYAQGGPGNLAAFNFALRIFELPIGILIAPIILIFLPLLSGLPGPSDPVFRDRTNLALRSACVLSVIAASIGGLFAQPIVAILFGHGEISGHESEQLARILQGLIVALPFFAIFQVMVTVLNASDRTRKVLFSTASALIVSLIIYVGMLRFGVSISASVHIAFVGFHVAACVFSVFAVGGLQGVRKAIELLVRTLGSVSVLVLPITFLNPWFRDASINHWDVAFILGVGTFLLLVHSKPFLELARVKDTLGKNDNL